MAKDSICLVPLCCKTARTSGLCNAHYLRRLRNGNVGPPGVLRPSRGEIDKFIVGLLESETDTCIIWPYARTPNGYGTMTVNQKTVMAHRFLCEMRSGLPPSKKHQAAHLCGRGHEGCVNPRHLRWATAKENARDKIIHGTRVLGEKQRSAKITSSQAIAIYSQRQFGGQHKTAKRFGVSRSIVEKIWSGKSWSWLTGHIR